MFKQKMAAVIALAAMVMPLVSSAAVTIQDGGMTINSSQTAHVRAGSPFNLMFLADVDGGDEVEFARVSVYDLYGNLMQAPECKAVDSRLVGVTNAQANVRGIKTASDLPDNEYRLVVETFGVAGPSSSNRCDNNNQNDDHDWTGRLFIDHSSSVSNADVVVGGSSSTGTGVGSADDAPSWMPAFLLAIKDLFKPAKPAACAGLMAKVAAGKPGKNSPVNTVLQQALLSAHTTDPAHFIDIPLLSSGAASYGFYGDQTGDAVDAAINACN